MTTARWRSSRPGNGKTVGKALGSWSGMRKYLEQEMLADALTEEEQIRLIRKAVG